MQDADAADAVRHQAEQLAPVVWLLGKVQSGKTSIIRALTGTTRAEVGDGYRACTQTAQLFDFPAESPLVRFLDTRGLGEAGYDASDDLEIAEASAHATIAVMRAMDPQQHAVIEALAAIRVRRPEWPIVVAQTHLHEAYPPGTGHMLPYPFEVTSAASDRPAPLPSVPPDLVRALAYQRELVRRIPGSGPCLFVPIDFTLDIDGLEPTLYGLDALQDALAEAGPEGLQALLERSNSDDKDAAVAADLIPVAAVAAVPTVQARLLQLMARSHGVAWTRRTAIEFAGALGAGAVARYAAGFGIRQLAKLIPVYGQTAGSAAAAATSFASTYALGKAADYYLTQRKRGQTDTAGVRRAWAQALRDAFKQARSRGLDKEARKA